MVEYETFIYLDTPKTASRWMVSILGIIVNEKRVRRFDHMPLEEKPDKPTFITVRSPFESSLSSFAYVNHKKKASGLRKMWPKRFNIIQGKSDVTFDPENVNKPIEFKRFMNDLVKIFPYGLQTGRHLKLALGLATEGLYVEVDQFFEGKTYEEVVEYEAQNTFIDYVVRVESLAEDLIHVLREIQPALHKNWESVIRSRAKIKVNASTHLESHIYYDDDLIKLVARNERFLIDKFGYTFDGSK